MKKTVTFVWSIFPPRVYIDRYERTINKKLGLPHKTRNGGLASIIHT